MFRKVKNLLIGAGIVLLAILYDYHIQGRRPVKARTVFLFWLSIVLLLVVARMLGAQVKEERVDSFPGHPFWVAITTCKNDQPVIIIRKDAYNDPSIIAVQAHEREHVAQIEKYAGGDCKLYQAFIESQKGFRFKMEALAFCHGGQVGTTVLGWNWPETLVRYASDLYNYYNLGMTLQDITDQLTVICRGVYDDQRQKQAPP